MSCSDRCRGTASSNFIFMPLLWQYAYNYEVRCKGWLGLEVKTRTLLMFGRR